jgi:hypothetical protein
MTAMRPSALALALILAAAATPARADDAKQTRPGAAAGADADATQWLAKGNKAFKEGRFADAERAYREAWTLKKGYDIAGNLGAAEMAQGKLREAAAHLAFTLRMFPLTGEPALRERMAKALEKCRQGVGTVRVEGAPRGASLRVDGAVVGEAPLADDVFVAPGEHTFEATLDGFTGAPQTARVDAGGTATVTLSLTPLAEPRAPVDQRPADAAADAPRRRSALPGMGLGTLSLAGIVGGVSFLVLSGARRQDADATRAQILAAHGGCVKGAGNLDARCAGLADTLHARDTLHDTAVGAFIVGGVAAAGAAAYFLWPQRAEPAGHALRVTPIFGGNSGAVMVSGEL